MRRRLALATILNLSLFAASCGQEANDDVLTPIVAADTPLPVEEKPAVETVDASRLFAADAEPEQWLSHGRTYSEQHYSPLDAINVETVGDLGLTWYADLDTNRGQEATPLMVDGVLYVSTAWSKVNAYDAASGEPLWAYDPEVPGEKAVHACCDVTNDGVAAWGDKVFVGALDGRLIALDAKTGQELWTTQTTEPDQPYSITSAPRVVKGKVLIGNDGAHFGVRGYLSAYDADTGSLAWRFYTTPGAPSDGFENVVLEKAAETWSGEWWWMGGGGAVSNGIAYDPELDMLFVGVGAGSPWNHTLRSAGQGDNLYLSSIVALDPDNGSYIWHYQTTPGDSWGFGASQQITIADIIVRSQEQRVVMQASGNGFFYTLDAASGELISADPIVPVSWASEIDIETGRPIENPNARYDITGEDFISNQPFGGVRHAHVNSYSQQTGFIYIPIQTGTFTYSSDVQFNTNRLTYNLGVRQGADIAAPGDQTTPAPPEAASGEGHLIAWDPVNKREAWRIERDGPMNGGVLSTAGGLVFQGGGAGMLTALDATSGEELWWSATQTGVIAAPISYAIDGTQYIAIVVGTGGALGMAGTEGGMRGAEPINRSRVLVYKLGGDAELPTLAEPLSLVSEPRPPFSPPAATASAAVVARGEELYETYCARCHGVEANYYGILPDLRKSEALDSADEWAATVLDGVLAPRGMVGYSRVLSDEDSEALRAYVISRAHAATPKAELRTTE